MKTKSSVFVWRLVWCLWSLQKRVTIIMSPPPPVGFVTFRFNLFQETSHQHRLGYLYRPKLQYPNYDNWQLAGSSNTELLHFLCCQINKVYELSKTCKNKFKINYKPRIKRLLQSIDCSVHLYLVLLLWY